MRVTKVSAQGKWQSRAGGQAEPFVAAGSLVLVVSAGSGWVMGTGGERVSVTAPSVVTWEPGERVEYGTDATEGWTVQDYWGPRARSDGFHPTD